MFKFFNLSLQINGFPIKKAVLELEKINAISEADFEEFILEKRNEIVNYHLKNNQSYQDFFGTSTFNNWNDVPIQTKKSFQKPLSERLSAGFTVKNAYVNKTSGSSGDPFILPKTKFSHALTWANIITKFGWFDIDFNSSRQARFYGIPFGFYGEIKKNV